MCGWSGVQQASTRGEYWSDGRARGGGSVPEYQISLHEANPWTAHCVRSREAVYRVMRSDPAVSSSLVPINAAFRIPHSIPIRVIAIIAGLAGRWP